MKIAVLGANGQVGSEVCLLLSRLPGIEVVPVCRNRSGSAFLRWHGLACRHGRPAEPAEAAALLGDCDVIANFALATGRPRQAREANRRLVESAATASPAHARLILFSTLAVYPEFLTAGAPRGETAYGREKLRGERDALRAGRAAGKPTWVLRLGHVYGELQGIRAEMRRLVSAGPVNVPRGGEGGSNVVHTATIVDAILAVAEGRSGAPGTYDLVSTPVWSWRQVLAAEAAAAGVPLVLEDAVPDPFAVAGPGARWRARLRGLAATVLASPRTREIGLRWIAHLPEPVNLRLQSRNFQRRAAAEIARLSDRQASHGAFTIPAIAPRELAGLAPTAGLLAAGRGAVPPATATTFAGDLPRAQP
jgi:nucleoside-diphosphate-sugar epimerase